MEGIFAEYENENSLRSYPFAAGCIPPSDSGMQIPEHVFIDAAIYPINPAGVVYLSGISDSGIFSISDDTGVVMTGVAHGNVVEFHDLSEMSRHVGTLVASSESALEELANRGVAREYSASNTAFAAACVFPVVLDGVISISINGSRKASGISSFTNDKHDAIRVSSENVGDGATTLRFDVLPRPGIKEEGSIRRIICVVDGQTPLRIFRMAYNVIGVYLEGADVDSICSAVHRENHFEMSDTCDCDDPPCKSGDIPSQDILPEHYHLEEIFIPPDSVPDGAEFGPNGGISEGAQNAFYLVAPNFVGSRNPVSITLEDGMVSPKVKEPEIILDGMDASLSDGAMVDSVTSKGVVIQVPGLSGGKI